MSILLRTKSSTEKRGLVMLGSLNGTFKNPTDLRYTISFGKRLFDRIHAIL